ncbi:MAG: MmgE/PrpD family protein, partial [Rhodospirillales bacterium]
MPSDKPTLALGEFAAGLTYKTLPGPVRAHLANLLLDYFRVAATGERMEWSRWANEYVRIAGGTGDASVLFSSDKTDPARAAFVNATYSGSIDADDVHVGSMLHPGCVVFSAALAVGQHFKLPGDEVLAAVAAGYEAMIRTADVIQPTHFRRGFQSTATCGGFGAATAVAALLFEGSDAPRRIAEAIGLVASMSGGLAQFYKSGSTVKRIHAAWACQSGTTAGLLARHGFSGPVDILEGESGFAQAYADAADFSKILNGLGKTFKLLEVTVKGHASSARVMAAVEGMAELCATHHFGLGDIEDIRIGIPSVIKGRLTIGDPIDLQAAQMSLPFSMALAAKLAPNAGAGLSLTVGDYVESMNDPNVRDLSKRIECEVDTAMDEQAAGDSVPADIAVT